MRWHMNRAGIVNFWFYDEEEFRLSDGRLILRGPNGSGKSVTMQSFLPLVLDGDKRPSRLDPFGSRDRKIEYYLLGERDKGVPERTGYLYLEFKDPSADKYLTVGIGLRARRGAPQVGFWGFAITDQRRIGRDIFLYHRDLWDGSEDSKVPLDRASLETAVGDGGKVVREQGEYRAMVNQLLFGFEDEEAYKELLNLLIQLRSPKLSKDHKPSAIYEVLNNSLPPLADDDLRSLSDVLEDLDEIADRLDELTGHREDLETLTRVYDNYNKLRLYQLSKQVVEEVHRVRELEADVDRRRDAWEQFDARVHEMERRREEAQRTVERTETQIDVIDRSEAMEKQRELEHAQEALAGTNRELENAERRRKDHVRSLDAKQKRSQEEAVRLHQLRQNENDSRMHLAELAEKAEFDDHAVYDALWGEGRGRTEESTWTSLQNDVEQYRSKLRAVRSLGFKVSQQQERKASAERSHSEAREARDEKERIVRLREEELYQTVENQQSAVIAWQNGLTELTVTEEHWHESLRRLQRYPEVSYGDVKEPIRKALAAAEQVVEKNRAKIQQQKDSLERDVGDHKRELEEWQHYREPEPPRSEARLRRRQRFQERMANKATPAQDAAGQAVRPPEVTGGPLYTLCEFQSHVDEATRAALETVLYQAGLLDAWVSPEGWSSGSSVLSDLQQDEEETWFRPNPLLFGETLAEYLRPAPSEESGLSLQQVDDVLRTVVMADLSAPLSEAEQSQMFVTTNGRFQIGPVSGGVTSKQQAQWIGTEARRRTRLSEIERLNTEIAKLTDEIAEIDLELKTLTERQERMNAEFAEFPEEERLKTAGDAFHTAKLDLDHAFKQEQNASERLKHEQRILRDLQTEYAGKVSGWVRLKSLDDFEEALESLNQFEVAAASLQGYFANSSRIEEDIVLLDDEIGLLQDRIEAEDAHLKDYKANLQRWLTSIASLEQLLEEAGVAHQVAQLEALRRERDEAKQAEKRFANELSSAMEQRGASKTALKTAEELLESENERLGKSIQKVQSEWQYGFVDASEIGMATQAVQQADNTIKAAKAVVNRWKSTLESQQTNKVESKVQEVFARVRDELRDYALEQQFDEVHGRLIIESRRDRANAVTPFALLQQLRQQEEEQKALINETDRRLYEQILLHSVGSAIRKRIDRAEEWVKQMNRFMSERKTSSGLVLSLEWKPIAAKTEAELDTDTLVQLLRKSPETLRQTEIDEMTAHFRSRINFAKELAEDGTSLRQSLTSLLDYRTWFRFTLFYKKGDAPRRELTDSRFNVLSGGEKAMSMYIPLFAATDSRYKDSRPTAPRIVSLDEAFAGVDEQNMSDMFHLLTDMNFDYMMTSQVLWGCYDSVPALSIYEVHRPNDVDYVTLIPYYWNGWSRELVEDGEWDAAREVAAGRS